MNRGEVRRVEEIKRAETESQVGQKSRFGPAKTNHFGIKDGHLPWS
jgi:hypothetical protein